MQTLPTIYHNIPAGVFPTDNQTNIFACPSTKKVYFVKSGKVNSFHELEPKLKRQILQLFLADPCARKDLGYLGFKLGIEKYASCLFGSLSSVADFNGIGEMQATDNYRCSDNCQCLFWKSKKISYKESVFTQRQLDVLQLITEGLGDKIIAHKLKITVNTLSDYKRRLQEKLNTFCKTSTAVKAIQEHLVR